jgi:heme exporter protein A
MNPLDIEDLTVRRGGRTLFESLNLTLGPGAAVIVTGPNGVGKSSLLRVCAGLLEPYAGKVRAEPSALADENHALEERQSLGGSLRFWAGLNGGDSAAGLEMMGLTGLAELPVRMLSTGQRKRASLARVIGSGRQLWLLDEPGNGLDQDGLDRLATATASHLAAGGALLAATHQSLPISGAARLTLG